MSGRKLSYHFEDDVPAMAQIAPKRSPKSLVPKLVGGGVLMLGTILLARALSARGEAEVARFVAAHQNTRGEYGKRS